VTGGVWSGSDASIHHRHLYIARRATPLLLSRQDQLWPETPQPLEQEEDQRAEG